MLTGSSCCSEPSRTVTWLPDEVCRDKNGFVLTGRAGSIGNAEGPDTR